MGILKKIEKSIRERKQRHRNQRDIESIFATRLRQEQLHQQMLTDTSSLVSDHAYFDTPLVVSLTSFAEKVHEVYLVVESLAQQTCPPNRIILWLDEKEYNDVNLPHSLKRQRERGLEVRYCENTKSYKKIIPTLNLVPEAYVLTVDDDELYPHSMIEGLIRTCRHHPGHIYGHRGHKITTRGGEVRPYKRWQYCASLSTPSHHLMLTGCEGILYPPQSLHPDVLDQSLFMQLAPSADDLWLKVMAIRQGSLCMKVPYSDPSFALKRHRAIGLAQTNIRQGGNDRQLKMLLDHYPEVRQALLANEAQ
ncbi:hypothetical protein [Salinivibrio costicola]|jgi:hypothetical protein|uniref:hypothetical protein n=1 Tax=Salinivibrio costicola TaxID=51367 RepID=UPI003F717440